jgi:hypothetical protein
MKTSNPTLIGAFQDLLNKLGTTPNVLEQARSFPHEEILVRYVMGQGNFSPDGKYISINCKAFTLDGEDNGTYVGVDEPLSQGQDLIAKVLQRPPQPPPPFDTPDGQDGKVEHIVPLSYSKGLRTFPDGSTITAVGPANLHAVVYVDGASQFWVTSNLIITNGTGVYQGAQGLKTVAGSTWVEPGKKLTDLGTFGVRTVEVYRIVRKQPMGPWPKTHSWQRTPRPRIA